MSNRTRIVCLHEGKKGNIDQVFISTLLRTLKPAWIRPFKGSNLIRPVPMGGRKTLIQGTPAELKKCLVQGSNTTLMVWADLDHDIANGDELKAQFWREAQTAGITEDQFDQVVFIFAKDRLENWIQFLNEGTTNEDEEGPRVKHNRFAADAAKQLARRCQQEQADPPLPPSLEWSCKNWRRLVARMS